MVSTMATKMISEYKIYPYIAFLGVTQMLRPIYVHSIITFITCLCNSADFAYIYINTFHSVSSVIMMVSDLPSNIVHPYKDESGTSYTASKHVLGNKHTPMLILKPLLVVILQAGLAFL